MYLCVRAQSGGHKRMAFVPRLEGSLTCDTHLEYCTLDGKCSRSHCQLCNHDALYAPHIPNRSPFLAHCMEYFNCTTHDSREKKYIVGKCRFECEITVKSHACMSVRKSWFSDKKQRAERLTEKKEMKRKRREQESKRNIIITNTISRIIKTLIIVYIYHIRQIKSQQTSYYQL